ncbi:replication-relaxation family protein [Streptomyces sp. NPDC059861]|uniref:replication-relaxation family protein n=1 Tax=Streptomyces sp. NPDC059861 TaxID=3346974 RepID=UPI003662F5CC
MGGIARGAARSGARHAMAVNETVIAIARTPPVATRPISSTRNPATAPPTETTPTVPAAPEGIGSIFAWSTEVALNLPSTGRNRSGVRADAVLQAPEAGAPVLLVEVDNCTEAADVVAAKFDKYLRFFRLQAKDHRGRDVPAWRNLYPPTGREGHPPVVVVFNPGTRMGAQALKNRMNAVMNATRAIWSGSYERMDGYGDTDPDGYYNYADAIPILFSTLERLQAHGPRAAVWWRCGHGQWEILDAALSNPNDADAWHQRDDERSRSRDEERERERQEQAAGWGEPAAARQPVPMQERPEQLDAARHPEPPAPGLCERCGQPGRAARHPLRRCACRRWPALPRLPDRPVPAAPRSAHGAVQAPQLTTRHPTARAEKGPWGVRASGG